MNLLDFAGMPHDEESHESPPLELKSRSNLIELVKGLTQLTAQQAREISSLRRRLSQSERANTEKTFQKIKG